MSKVSLRELMGDAGAAAGERGMSLDDLKELLGEKMPELPKNKVGKFRLLNALKVRFGTGFRNIPGISDILAQFDEEMGDNEKIEQMKQIRVERQDG